jgi:hypothetical protein
LRALHTLELQSVSNIDAGRARLHAQGAIDAITGAIRGRCSRRQIVLRMTITFLSRSTAAISIAAALPAATAVFDRRSL